MITGNPDSDRKILLLLEHREFTAICTPSINKYINRICDEHFYRNLLYIKVPSHIQYKPSNVTYKKFYQIVINRIKNLLEILKIDWSTRCPFEVFVMEIHRPYFTYFPLSAIYYTAPYMYRYFKDVYDNSLYEFIEVLETSEILKMRKIYRNISSILGNTVVTIDLIVKIRLLYGKANNQYYDYFAVLKEYQEEFVPMSVLAPPHFEMLFEAQMRHYIKGIKKVTEEFLI